jgi:hypothetical protein
MDTITTRTVAGLELQVDEFGQVIPPVMAGGQDPDVIQYPYDLPAGVADFNYLVANPRRVTRSIARLALQGFYVNQIFSSSGPVLGAVVYEQATENDLYPERDIERVEPGDEFPVVTFASGEARTAQVEKFGGKFPVTDEARRRNQGGRVLRAMQQIANTIQRKTQQRALAELDAAIVEHGRSGAGSSWADATAVAAGAKVNATGPLADLTLIEEQNETLELGYSYNTLIINPVDWRNFRLATGSGSNAEARALLADSGINTVWRTNRQPQGKAKFVAAGQVGEMGYEVPLSTETWRDKDGKQQDWFQTYVLPIVYVTDPFAIFELTGLQA